ncbi:sodium:neurotransmitter symporter family protein [Clostridium acetireducens DSM 10703]|jgi:NSS family neurotransmitter:Na+ symporter|uniref:Sodium:neurotransmitter symporter family protein n=1 Tax=Clostridium acetireducens DSM 10703 TaxID=1121290 RepID=A0A1E8EYL6_9CLOT|nr:sodium-dependent transporter [Clostridium acetireducens]OFI06049.1 sodium:neurotransmitter symporter family protein [Clostridium acetireducens DSM 10703]
MVERENFTSKIGFVLACLGSAIGLGNIWMFPWKLGQYGGAAFLIPYFIFVFLLGVTGLIGEFSFGRSRRSGSLKGIREVFKEKNKPFGNQISVIPTLAVFGTLIFYGVVVGWVFRYFFASVKGSFNYVDIPKYFENFAGTQQSIIWHFIAVVFTIAIVILGVTKGIERMNKILMPGLFIIFLILLVRTLTLPGAMKGVEYLLIPRWSYLLKPETWIMALGQAFFTVSLNGAGMVVYGSYLKDDVDIPKAAIQVAIFDTLAALLAAFVIIPAVFAFGLDPSAGPSLLFITMPFIFKSMPLGYLFGVLFFLSIIFAAVSSLINMLEASTEAYMNRFEVSRFKGCIIVGLIAFAIGVPLDLSMARFGICADFITIFLAPLGSIIASICFFWVYGSNKAREDINIGAKKPLGKWFEPVAKYVFTGAGILVLILGAIYNGIG